MGTTASREKIHLLINRNFTLLWIGQAISQVGDFFFDTTLILWIATSLAKGQSWTPLAISGAALAATLPTLLVGPIAGIFVDRWDKRRTMLRMDGQRAIIIAMVLPAVGIIPLPFMNGHLPVFWQLGYIYALIVLENVCSQFFSPSRLALIGDIVPEAMRSRAMSLSQITLNMALILGPSLAAPLYFSFGAQWAIIIDSLSFPGSFLAILLIKAPHAAHSLAPGQRPHFLRELGEGLRFFKGNHVLIALVVTGVLFQIGGGASDALYILFVLSNLHTPPGLAGLFGAAYGAGVIAASFVLALLARRLGEARVLSLSLLSWGFFMIVFSRATSFVPGLIAFFMLGVSNAGINVTVGPLLLHTTPRQFVGRISSVMNPSITLAAMASAAIAGYLVSNVLRGLHASLLHMSFGPLDTVFMVSGILVIGAGAYAMLALRGADLSKEQPVISAREEVVKI
jgi:MFS family permease